MFAVKRSPRVLPAMLAVLVGGFTLNSAVRKPYRVNEKAFYAPDALVNFVRPGLTFNITGASIAGDGTIKATLNITDANGLVLDRTGLSTPGAVSVNFIASVIPNGGTDYKCYTTRVQTSPITGQSAVQSAADSGGIYAANADGTYTYTFATKAPTGFDATATHTIGVYGSRDLTQFQLGTNYASTTYNFVPAGSTVTNVHQVVTSAACNACHDKLNFHGGSRVGVELCVVCHNPTLVDPDTGNNLNMVSMAHKIHMGSSLPSVVAGGKYQIIGFNQTVSDFSTVVYPADVRRCQTCHDPKSGAKQANSFLLKPNREACGACHDDVNFATGKNHSPANLPQLDDKLCSQCHTPQGEVEFDASIEGAHTIPTESVMLPGVNAAILDVSNNAAGQAPKVTFTVKDNKGVPIAMSELKVSPGRAALVLAGPTSDYGYTDFGSDVLTAGYVSEDATNAICAADGTCVYQFAHSIPATAKGTFSIGMEVRRGATLLPNTLKQQTVEYGAKNVVFNFSVDGTPVTNRRAIVSINNCNQCHSKLSVHGENRNQVEMCVLCHNPSETDYTQRMNSKDPTIRNAANQGINFTQFIHKLHTPALQSNAFTVIAFGASPVSFGNVKYPAMSPQGETGDTRNCNMCHIGDSQQNLPTGKNLVTDPSGLIAPRVGPVTSACTACHTGVDVASHALSQTAPGLGESCEVCHGAGAQFNIGAVHAQE